MALNINIQSSMAQPEGKDHSMHDNKQVVPKGTTIHQEKPFVYILSSKYRTECCDFCFKKSTDLFKCSNCRYVYYCGKICQRQSWSIHKQECKNLKQISPRVLPDAARILFRLYKTLENGGDTIKSYYATNKFRSWRDLMSHYPELKTDQRRMEHLTSLYGVLYEFSQEDMLPNSAEFMGLYGRMCVNSFNICNQELQNLGTGIYLAASMIDHSCQPNALATFEGTTIYIRTLETLPYLDWAKIRISYIDVLATTKERRKELQETYYFLCDCPKCLEPEDRSISEAACPNKNCNNSISINDNHIDSECGKCGTLITKDFADEFKNVLDFTSMHLDNMRNTTLDLDVCKVCLKKQEGVLYKYHIKHVKILDLAFESCIDLEAFDTALEYGLKLIECYRKYYPKIHPLPGLLHLKISKLLLYKGRTTEAVSHLRKGTDIIKITHGNTSSLLYTNAALIQQCRDVLSGTNGIK